MLDVVAPNNPSYNHEERGGKDRRRRLVGAESRKRQTMNQAGPKVVQIDWRLPARLRRPVREEMTRMRRQKKQREAIVRFERRPIYSELPSTAPAYGRLKVPKQVNRGVEYHTGDVYRQSKPTLKMTLPPYVGLAVKRRTAPTTKVTVARTVPVKAENMTRKKIKRPGVANWPSRKKEKIPTGLLVSGERDVSYSWSQEKSSAPATLEMTEPILASATIEEPRRRFALPLHFSIWPFGRLPGKKHSPMKHKPVLGYKPTPEFVDAGGMTEDNQVGLSETPQRSDYNQAARGKHPLRLSCDEAARGKKKQYFIPLT